MSSSIFIFPALNQFQGYRPLFCKMSLNQDVFYISSCPDLGLLLSEMIVMHFSEHNVTNSTMVKLVFAPSNWLVLWEQGKGTVISLSCFQNPCSNLDVLIKSHQEFLFLRKVFRLRGNITKFCYALRLVSRFGYYYYFLHMLASYSTLVYLSFALKFNNHCLPSKNITVIAFYSL
jgi:hypothetical protein